MTPNVLVVHPSVPARSLKEFIAYARANPGKLSYGTSAAGSSQLLTMELFKLSAKIDVVFIPYKGAPQSLSDTIGGQIPCTVQSAPGVLSAIETGRVRALAVTSPQRAPLLPDVPALAETLKGFDIVLYNGIMGPAGMPRDVVGRLNKELARMMTLPAIKEAWAKQGADPIVMTPEQVTDHLKSDISKLGQMVRAAGAKVD